MLAVTVRRAVLVLVAVGLLPSAVASAAQVTATNLFSPPTEVWSYTVSMGSEVSTVTIEAVAGDPSRFRIIEAGAVLTRVLPSPSSGPDPCVTESATSVLCKVSAQGVRVVNSGGSSTPPLRDQVIVRGSAHGDAPASRANVPVSIGQTAGLIEFWSGDAGGAFVGSDIATGTPAVPADIVHGLAAGGCLVTCDLRGGADRFEGGAASDNVSGGAGDDTLLGSGGNDTLSGGAQDDLIIPGAGRDSVTGGPGRDTLSFDDAERTGGLEATFVAGVSGTIGRSPFDDSTQPESPGTGDAYAADVERLVGTPVADRLTGGPNADDLGGGGGDDVLIGMGGPDRLDGGSGSDAVDYSGRSADRPVTVTLASGAGGSAADDGTGDVLTAIEGVTGTAGDDVLTGDDAPNRLAGGPGADVLRGEGGGDELVGDGGLDAFFGGDGDDRFLARDGLAESVDCGNGAATLDIDDIDLPRNCPAPPRVDTAPADSPAPVLPQPGPGSAVVPSTVPGTGVPPSARRPSPARALTARATLGSTILKDGRTRVRTLAVTGLRPGDAVALRCTGRGCRASATPKPRSVKKGSTLSLTAAVAGLRVRAGATLVVTVTRSGWTGRVFTFTAAKRKAPIRTTQCLVPGSKAPQAC